MSRRQGPLSGSGGNRLFSREEVLAIRAGRGDSAYLRERAKEFGVSENCLYQIYSGTTYANVVEMRQDSKPLVIRPKRYTTLGRF